ncbi:MAG: hypothetical protein SFY69_11290 [Planctomycetota bacterium]|nr:hypothetical protein [Planctomycetota bacterium]
MRNRRRAHLALVLAGAFAGLGHGAPSQAAGPAGAGEVISVPPDATLATVVGLMRNPATPDKVRVDAAARLLQQREDTAWAGSMSDVLGEAGSPACLALLGAIAASPDAPDSLASLLGEALAQAPAGACTPFLDALGSIRTREAARLLVEHLGAERPATDRAAAAAALLRLSGLSAPPPGGWTSWLATAEEMADWEWRRQVTAAFVRRADALREQNARLREQLIESQRRLHALTPPAERGAFVAGLLDNPEGGARLLGLELAARELSGSGTLGPEVGTRVLALLRDPDPALRGGAARIVRQMAPDGAADAVTTALQRESDPDAAAPLLLAAARWPSAGMREAALSWMEREGPAREEAAEAVWQLYRAAELNPENQRRALQAARSFPDDALEPAVLGILASLGGREDRARIAPLLRGASPARRVAAARALVWYPEHLDAILEAAKADVELFDVASRSLVLHDATSAGYARLLALPRPAPDVAAVAWARLAGVLPAADLWAVSTQTEDPADRRRLLRELTSEGRRLSEWSDPAQREAICRGALALARMRIDDNTPDDAIAVLDPVPFEGPDRAEASALRCEALLALGRVEEATSLDVGVGAWLRGLAASLRKPHAALVVTAIEERFGEALTSEQRSALQDAMATISAVDGPMGPPAPPPR